MLNAEVSVVATTGETLVRIVEKDVGRKAQRCISNILSRHDGGAARRSSGKEVTFMMIWSFV